ncbi:hypothetical protein SteCoe_34229 [Stentor coeruleus]|uniref:Uncharacterized protein n=1 Tax=Stentor coeruleus TaxID=5963 RepID=A0A1R2AV05_9CILI|nr:hypothetical protein SteCoe_34229 [Stentor coeruleus]
MDKKKIEFFLKEIAISLYTELSHDDKQCLGPDLESVLSLSPKSTINILNELYEGLIDCKKAIKKVDFYKEFSENECYQKALQKLDDQIRNHIRSELQMKVFIDTNEDKLSKALSQKTQIINANINILNKIKEDNKTLKANLALKIAEFDELKNDSLGNDEKQIAGLKAKAQKNIEKTSEYEKMNIKLKQRWAQAKTELEIKNREYEKHRSEFVYLKKVVGASEDLRSISKHTDKSEKESYESKSGRTIRTPNKMIERSISPIPTSYNHRLIQNSKVTQSTKRLEKSPLSKILKTDLSKYKSKSRMPIYASLKK